jgi:hypothetical protein
VYTDEGDGEKRRDKTEDKVWKQRRKDYDMKNEIKKMSKKEDVKPKEKEK